MDPTNNNQQIPQIVPPPPPTPVIEPSPISMAVPVSDNAQVVKPKKKWGTGALIGSVAALMVLVVGLGVGLNLLKQRQAVETSAKYTELGILIANVTNTSISVWWKSTTADTGCVVATNLTTNQEIRQCDDRKSPTHLIAINNLSPKTQYKLVALQGKKELTLSPFWGKGVWTNSSLPTITPVPITGRVLSFDQKPFSEATVFIAPNLSDRLYIPAATLTDKNGQFSLIPPPLGPKATSYFVEVTDKNGNKLLETSFSKEQVSSFLTITIPK